MPIEITNLNELNYKTLDLSNSFYLVEAPNASYITLYEPKTDEIREIVEVDGKYEEKKELVFVEVINNYF